MHPEFKPGKIPTNVGNGKLGRGHKAPPLTKKQLAAVIGTGEERETQFLSVQWGGAYAQEQLANTKRTP